MAGEHNTVWVGGRQRSVRRESVLLQIAEFFISRYELAFVAKPGKTFGGDSVCHNL